MHLVTSSIRIRDAAVTAQNSKLEPSKSRSDSACVPGRRLFRRMALKITPRSSLPDTVSRGDVHLVTSSTL